MMLRIPLGEICEFLYGDGLTEENRTNGRVPVYGSNGIVGWHDHAITKGPTIVVGRKGSLGEVHYSPIPCFPIDTTYYIERTKKPCDLRWLSFMLVQLDLTRLNSGSAIPGLNREDAYRQELPFPPEPEQKRIVAILERADRLRRMRRYAIEIGKSVAAAAFREIFGSPESSIKTFPASELGKETRFIDYRGISPNKVTSGVRLVTARNVKRGSFELDPQEFIPAAEYEGWMRRGIPRTGDVLFTTEGHTLGSAAKLPSFDRVALAQRLIAFQMGVRLTSDYLLHLILTEWFQEQVAKRSTGSAARGISSKLLAEILIPVPPLLLQQQFASIAQCEERIQMTAREAFRQADHLFQSLLQRAFTVGL